MPPQKRMECFRLLLDYLAWIEHEFLSGIRDSRKPGSLWRMIRGVGAVRKSIHHSWLAKGFGLGLLCWGFKGVQQEIPWEEASTFQIGSVAFPPGQCTCPQLHPCHRLFDQDGHQDSSSASLYSRLCSLWAQRLSLWGNWWDERGWDEGHWHAHTRGLAEVVGTVQQVHCSRRRLLRSGLEFHVSTINKSDHTKKSQETYLMILVSLHPIGEALNTLILSLCKEVRPPPTNPRAVLNMTLNCIWWRGSNSGDTGTIERPLHWHY